ncbi:DEKNAAC102522 [Brettanomyces naardenensis]|uniref:DEKNAAC102522 n=1 Tax=Brettanomyces naardenensis TaxID=13370 RepID=A0A448YKW6_BRENA|nr:DEKNAAC102522 [Brettanomyces naardenensis]
MSLQISIDRGGTFCDIWAKIPNEGEIIFKILSEDPRNYADAPAEGIRLVLEKFTGKSIPRGEKLDGSLIEWVRMGTTVATNALLERKGEPFVYFTTKGFEDVLEIGTQARPELFNLKVAANETLFDKVVGVDERITVETSSDDPNPVTIDPEDPQIRETPSGTFVRVLKPLDVAQTTKDLQNAYDSGYRAIAVCLAHAYLWDVHEKTVAEIARKIGFKFISISSEVSRTINYLHRGNSTCIDAYLTPHVQRYVSQFLNSFSTVPTVQIMQSNGGLADARAFKGINAILSGPAGGVVGVRETCYENTPVVGFDMGGTSTDVSRYDGNEFDISFDNKIAGLDISAPQLRIHTVAAGGGSILRWQKGLFHVGPESAGSDPGAACYRKGGPLTVTDANLFLGRLVVSEFPHIFGKSGKEPLDVEIVRKKFEELAEQVGKDTGNSSITSEDVALGFLNVANVKMANSIREITESRGYAAKDHLLVSFGGAGSQNCTAVARNLGIGRVLIHKYSSVLSSYGIAKAQVARELKAPFVTEFTDTDKVKSEAEHIINELRSRISDELSSGGKQINFTVSLGMKYNGSNTIFEVSLDSPDLLSSFLAIHRREFGFVLAESTPIFTQSVSVKGVRVQGSKEEINITEELKEPRNSISSTLSTQRVYFSSGYLDTPVYRLPQLHRNDYITGPALIVDPTQTILVEPGTTATIIKSHVVLDIGGEQSIGLHSLPESLSQADPILLTVFGHRFMGIAETMGRTLQRTSVSTSIKERLDFSCAIFGPDGSLVANAPHIPIHLGSMQYAIQYQHQKWKGRLKKGDVLVSNHPEAGGTHLPDITVITPVFNDGEIVFYVASRGHHADIGGAGITAMSPNSRQLWQEGVSIKSFKLVSEGKFDEEGIVKLFMDAGKYPGCSATRKINDNLNDLRAQVSANQKGIGLVEGLFKEYGKKYVQFYMAAIRHNAEVAVRDFFREQYKIHGGKPLHAIDWFDDGIPVECKITFDGDKGEAMFDFTGTGPEEYGPMNTPPSITYSCVIYVVRCLIDLDIPLNQGCLAPCHITIPSGTILNPSGDVAICGSTISGQRITDVILKCFGVAAASQGDANSFGWGRGGKDPYTGKVTPGFAAGEALGGGVGAMEGYNGASACNVHCTNTKTTDIEVVETRTPVVISQWCIRRGSGGKGKWKGGDGATREIEARVPLRVSILSERRIYEPYGIEGGLPGESGSNYWYRKQKDGNYIKTHLNAKEIIYVKVGDRVRVNTPAGGGFGVPEE